MNRLTIAFRSLAKSPGFTLIALVTLALGIGVNTSMFSVVEALLFRSGPFPDPDAIVQITGSSPQEENRNYSAIELGEIRGRTTAFSSLTTLENVYGVVAEADRPTQRMSGVMATADLFTTFGVQPIRGRVFTAAETEPGRNRVIVISHGCWLSRYGGDENVLGRTLRLDGEVVEIIGVMPASFDYQLLWQNAQYWRPINFTKDQLEWRDYRAFRLIGRLAPGITPGQATAEIAPLASTQAATHPESYTDFRYRVRPLHDTMMDQLGHQISWTLLGLSGFVLLLTCANLANLQLARAATNLRDLAIRAALGASRRQLILLQLQEGVLLSLAGGGLGLLLALGINSIVSARFVIGGRTGLPIPIDGTILAITLVVALITGVLFGIVPAWLASRIDMNAALKAQARGSTTGRGHHVLRRGLVVIEVALALVLLGGAGIMQRGFTRFLDRDPGWDADHVLTASLGFSETHFENYAQRSRYFRKLELRLAAIPGVEHAALATSLPVQGYNGDRPFFIEGQSQADAARLPTAFHVMISSDYFPTMGIKLIDGRLFPAELPEKSPPIVIINESLARRLWPKESAVGHRIATIDSGIAFWYEIVGVVRDVEDAASLQRPRTRFTVYKPISQEPWSWTYLVVRGQSPAGFAEAVRRAALDADPDLPADLVETVPEMIDDSQHNLQLAGKTIVAFAGLGLLLAAVGIYGVISSLVVQRTSEFGIRLALGAQPRDVRALVLRDGMLHAGIGLVVGLIGASLLTHLLGSMLPRLVSLDLVALGLVSLLLAFVALLACWLPARRATRVDPLVALRAE